MKPIPTPLRDRGSFGRVMREERGTIGGDWTVTDEVELWGSVGGNVTVDEGGKLKVGYFEFVPPSMLD